MFLNNYQPLKQLTTFTNFIASLKNQIMNAISETTHIECQDLISQKKEEDLKNI